jgi:phytoene synthase
VSDEALPYAVMQGVGLQLVNILRDIGEDYRIGRPYLPRDDLAEFGRDLLLPSMPQRVLPRA